MHYTKVRYTKYASLVMQKRIQDQVPMQQPAIAQPPAAAAAITSQMLEPAIKKALDDLRPQLITGLLDGLKEPLTQAIQQMVLQNQAAFMPQPLAPAAVPFMPSSPVLPPPSPALPTSSPTSSPSSSPSPSPELAPPVSRPLVFTVPQPYSPIGSLATWQDGYEPSSPLPAASLPLQSPTITSYNTASKPSVPRLSLTTSVISAAQSAQTDLEKRALQMLRQLLNNPTATWSCPEQQQGVLAALEAKRDIMAAMGTGSGKTMLMIIPALLEKKKITIGILPLKSLLIDLKRRLDQMKVPYQEFTPDSTRLTGQPLVLVSVENSKRRQWKEAIATSTLPIQRVVFDEAHFPITSASYRPALREIYDIRTGP